MGCLMTGIIMAGRTGAAFAAQLGTMRVNEEIDALITMGIPPMDFLVLPRMLALVVMMPLLTVYSDLLAIFGGAFVGVTMLDLGLVDTSIMAYAERHRLPILTFDFRDFRATSSSHGPWRLVLDEEQLARATRG